MHLQYACNINRRELCGIVHSTHCTPTEATHATKTYPLKCEQKFINLYMCMSACVCDNELCVHCTVYSVHCTMYMLKCSVLCSSTIDNIRS